MVRILKQNSNYDKSPPNIFLISFIICNIVLLMFVFVPGVLSKFSCSLRWVAVSTELL